MFLQEKGKEDERENGDGKTECKRMTRHERNRGMKWVRRERGGREGHEVNV